MSAVTSAEAGNPLDQLSASQRALLRIICWVAWSDGDFAAEERELLERLAARLLQLEASGSGAGTPSGVELVRALAAEALGDTDLQALVAALEHTDERRLAVKLALQMVSISQGEGDTAAINTAEKQAYRRLVEALALSEDDIRESEWAAREELARKPSLLALLTGALERFGAWPQAQQLDPHLPQGLWL